MKVLYARESTTFMTLWNTALFESNCRHKQATCNGCTCCLGSWVTKQPVKTSSSLHGPSTLIAHRYFMPRTHCQMPLMIYYRHSDWIQLDWPMCMAISIHIISPHHKTISQHSQECKDPRRQFFVDLWPWPLTFWSQNKWVSTTHHTVTHFYVKFSLETGSLVLWAN